MTRTQTAYGCSMCRELILGMRNSSRRPCFEVNLISREKSAMDMIVLVGLYPCLFHPAADCKLTGPSENTSVQASHDLILDVLGCFDWTPTRLMKNTTLSSRRLETLMRTTIRKHGPRWKRSWPSEALHRRPRIVFWATTKFVPSSPRRYGRCRRDGARKSCQSRRDAHINCGQ